MQSVEEELAAEADEPPDGEDFSPRSLVTSPAGDYVKSPLIPMERKESLLTRALLLSPDMRPVDAATGATSRGVSVLSNYSITSATSTVSMADLISDAELTSPARSDTPSPPPPVAFSPLPPALLQKRHQPQLEFARQSTEANPDAVVISSRESAVEAGLGRKRCITFGCPKVAEKEDKGRTNVTSTSPPASAQPAKRSCTLKFACPTRPDKTAMLSESPKQEKRPCSLKFACPPRPHKVTSTKEAHKVLFRSRSPAPPRIKIPVPPQSISEMQSSVAITNSLDLKSSTQETDVTDVTDVPEIPQAEKEVTKPPPTEFHEFASSPGEEDEWVNKPTDTTRKITINDTLEKENKIRKIGEEAEEEALEEEQEEEDAEDEDGYEDEDQEDSDDDEPELSDESDGNETDNEEGFADSDNESDGGSEYEFWTPGLTTAATSTERLDHIRPFNHRADSISSIESILSPNSMGINIPPSPQHRRRPKPRVKMLPGTPELPDSTDFVCGTLDEDRPLEAAYMSCLEQRKRAKHIPVPQDIDPSFPTTDPEDEEDEHFSLKDGDDYFWIPGRMEDHVEDQPRGRRNTTTKKSPILSPRKYHSPPPLKRNVHRSPLPRRLFGQSPKQPQSPPPRHTTSPPPSRRVSLDISPKQQAQGIHFSGLAQRPNLIHASSLPRTPNPFFNRHNRCNFEQVSGTEPERALKSKKVPIHMRGPADIYRGLEKKKQKRREKYQRLHARNGCKERRVQPGEGAERMKELGLEMAGRGKIYGPGQQPKLMLSI